MLQVILGQGNGERQSPRDQQSGQSSSFEDIPAHQSTSQDTFWQQIDIASMLNEITEEKIELLNRNEIKN